VWRQSGQEIDTGVLVGMGLKTTPKNFFSRFAQLSFFILSTTTTMMNCTGAVQLTNNKGELNMHETVGGTTFSPVFRWWDCVFIETHSFATTDLFFNAN